MLLNKFPSTPETSWTTEDDLYGQIRVASSEIVLLPGVDSTPNETALPEEPRVQEPYEVALKV